MQTIAYKNINWLAVYQKLKKVWRQWGMIAMVLMNTGATMRALGVMYKEVVQLVLLYVSESWVLTGEMLKILKGFHHRVARWITEMTNKLGLGGEW